MEQLNESWQLGRVKLFDKSRVARTRMKMQLLLATSLTLASLPLLSAQQSVVGGCVVTIAGPVMIEGQPSTAVQLYNPYGLAPDGAGGVYCVDQSAVVVRRFFVNGTSRTLGGAFLRSGSSDGPATAVRLLNPVQVAAATDAFGGAFVAARSTHQIRRIFSNGSSVTGELGRSRPLKRSSRAAILCRAALQSLALQRRLALPETVAPPALRRCLVQPGWP